MPNLYVTEDELKAVMPDSLRSTNMDYDKIFIQLAKRLSRWIDNHTQRIFFPFLDTRFYSVQHRHHRGHGAHDHHQVIAELDDLWIDDVMEIDSVATSEDDGSTYTTLATGNYIPMHGQGFNSEKSFNLLKLDRNGTLGSWPVGQRSVRVNGTFNFTEDRSRFFEDTADAVNHATGINVTDTTLKLNDVDGADRWGIEPRISPGQLLRIELEQMEVISTDNATGVQTATVVRGVNGTTAAAHVDTTQVDKFMAPEPLKQACIIQAIKQFKRGQSGFGDAAAQMDLGRILVMKTIDPEALVLLQAYKALEYG